MCVGGEPSTILLNVSLICYRIGEVVAHLLTSLPAEMAEGTGYGSSTVTFLYPLRASQRAVDEPQVPQPTIRTLVDAGSVGGRLLEVMVLYAEGFFWLCWNYDPSTTRVKPSNICV